MRLRYHLLALLCAVAWFAVSTDGASAAGCRAPRDAGDLAVIVKVDVGEPNVYNSMGKAQLGTSNIHGRERQILGTTNSGLALRWSYSYQIRDWKNVYCFWVASVEVEISYRQLDVNIASEYEPGSCQYEAVLDHEYEHVQVAQSVMQPYSRQIQQALTSLAIPTSHLPSVANSPEDAREEVEEVFRRTLGPVREKIDRLLQVNQAVVDTKENYRKTFRRCAKW